MDIDIKNNEKESCFEVFIDGYKAYLGYDINDKKIFINTVQVPSVLGGKGLGKKLSYKAIEYANENKLEIVAICSFFEKIYEIYKSKQK